MNVATIAGLLRERAQLRAHDVQVAVDLVDAIPRTAMGKAPLIRRAQLATAAH